MGASITNTAGRQRREGKVRPLQGNSPHDRPVSRGTISSLRRICDDPFHATPFPLQRTILRRPVCVFQAWRNLSGPMWFQNQNQTPGRDRAASRWTAPSPGKRTRREDRAPSHRPQMSSGRLFLDRVARQQSPSPLHRYCDHKTLDGRKKTDYHRTVTASFPPCLTRGVHPIIGVHRRLSAANAFWLLRLAT